MSFKTLWWTLCVSISVFIAISVANDLNGFNDLADSYYRPNAPIRVPKPLKDDRLREAIESTTTTFNFVTCFITNTDMISVTNAVYETNDFSNSSMDTVQHKLDYAKRLNSIPRPVAAIDELIKAMEELNRKVNAKQ